MKDCGKMDISITVIIPVYNVEKYLPQCLDSVVRQSDPFDEVVIINDGSTDNSLAKCREYAFKYRYFKLIDQENQGLSAARNYGIKCASSEYIMFLDSDDYLRPDTVKVLKRQILGFPYDAVFFDAEIICEKEICPVPKNIYDRSDANLDGIRLEGWEYFSKCYPQNYVASCCMAVYKKEVIISTDIRFPEGLYFEDNYFMLMFMCQAGSVAHISEKLYQRRYRGNSITTGVYSERKFVDYIKCLLFTMDEICHIEQRILIKLRETLLEFISDWCNGCFNNYARCINQNIVLGRNAIYFFCRMQEKYLWLLDKLSVQFSCLDLPVFSKIIRNFYYIESYGLKDKKDIRKKVSGIMDVGKRLYLHILKDIPLNKICKVGIYGTGKHTEGLLNIFEKLIGEITCNLIFLDSQKDNGWYKGRKIVNYRKINDEGLDLIIISSFLYEDQMLKNIKSINHNILVHTFYRTLKRDIFSEYRFFCNFL